jgi:integrase
MQKQAWQATKIPNLFTLNGFYYIRVKPQGQKQIREALRTRSFNDARERMRRRMLELEVPPALASGTWGGVVEPWRVWLDGEKVKKAIGGSTIDYKLELLDAIRKTWPDWDRFKLVGVTEKRLGAWLVAHREKYSATRTNGAVTVLREMLALAVKDRVLPREQVDEALHGLKFVSVDYDYKRMTLELPEPAQVSQLRDEIYHRCTLRGTLGGYLFDGLLFSGMRIDSAGHVLREDVHRDQGVLFVRKAKYGTYTLPLFPDLLELIGRIEKEIPGGAKDRLFPTKSLQTVLTAACKHMKLAHLSHHDIRHIFATRCIEAGVDIPTLASWMGHKDGGRTCMQIYGLSLPEIPSAWDLLSFQQVGDRLLTKDDLVGQQSPGTLDLGTTVSFRSGI